MPKAVGEILEVLNRLPEIQPRLEGDPGYSIEAPAPLAEAGPVHISFFGDARHKEALHNTRAGCLILADKLEAMASGFQGVKIIVRNTPVAWAQILKIWAGDPLQDLWGIDPKSQVARSAKLGRQVYVGALTVIEERCAIADHVKIYPQCYIGSDVVIGKGTVIYPQAVIRERCRIGSNVIIHSGVVIGSDGFGFVTAGGKHEKVPQIGTIEIGDEVEIGANVTIDRAQIGVTRIGRGAKLDNLVHIAHNVQVGENCLIAAQVGIAGSSVIGNGVIFGGQAGVADHITIADGTIVVGQSGIIGNVKTKDILWGTPARNHREVLRLQAILNKLPEMYEEFKKRKKKENADNA